MAQVRASELTEDRANWLLVTAYNYLQQGQPEQAVTLLEFLRVLDASNFQCLKMLAYGYLMQGEAGKSAELLAMTQHLSLTKHERNSIRLLQSHVLQNALEGGE